jgi:hypothetical protein
VLSAGDCGGSSVATDTWHSDEPGGQTGTKTLTAADPPTPGAAADGEIEFNLGMPLSGAAGDSYRMCWGPSPSVEADFKVDVDGNTELVGPDAPGSYLKCTLGVPCVVQVTGYKLASTNRIAVLASGDCGSNNPALWDPGWERPPPVTGGGIFGTHSPNPRRRGAPPGLRPCR